MTVHTNGSEPWFQSDWPTVNEAARILGIPTDLLRAKLMNQGMNVTPDERWPLEVIRDTLEREGYVREPLLSVSGRPLGSPRGG